MNTVNLSNIFNVAQEALKVIEEEKRKAKGKKGKKTQPTKTNNNNDDVTKVRGKAPKKRKGLVVMNGGGAHRSAKDYKRKDKFSKTYESNKDESPFEVKYQKGTSRKVLTKIFKTEKEYIKWIDEHDDDVEVLGNREVDENFKITSSIKKNLMKGLRTTIKHGI